MPKMLDIKRPGEYDDGRSCVQGVWHMPSKYRSQKHAKPIIDSKQDSGICPPSSHSQVQIGTLPSTEDKYSNQRP